MTEEDRAIARFQKERMRELAGSLSPAPPPLPSLPPSPPFCSFPAIDLDEIHESQAGGAFMHGFPSLLPKGLRMP